jgi:hypothetical protein
LGGGSDWRHEKGVADGELPPAPATPHKERTLARLEDLPILQAAIDGWSSKIGALNGIIRVEGEGMAK